MRQGGRAGTGPLCKFEAGKALCADRWLLPWPVDAGGVGRFEGYLVAAIAVFGILQSILLFGYKQVPISDFTAIFQTGHELLSLKAPASFK